MDLLYPRICMIAYGNVDFTDNDTYNYYSDNECLGTNLNEIYRFYENSAHLRNQNDDALISASVWRCSLKSSKANNNNNDAKSASKSQELYKNKSKSAVTKSDKLINLSLKKPLTAPLFTRENTEFATSFKSKTLYNLYENSKNVFGNEQRNESSDPRKYVNSLFEFKYQIQNEDHAKHNNKLPQLNASASASKNEIYLEYINLVNNPAFEQKFLSSTVKLHAAEKLPCSKICRNHPHEIEHKEHEHKKRIIREREHEIKAKNPPLKPVRSNSPTKLQAPKVHPPKPQPPPPPPPPPAPPKTASKPKPPPEPKENKKSEKVKEKPQKHIEIVTNIDKIDDNNSTENLPEVPKEKPKETIIEEIAKLPKNIDKLSDKEFKKLERDLGVFELEKSTISLASSKDLDEVRISPSPKDKKKTSKLKKPEKKKDKNNKEKERPKGAPKERPKVVHFKAEEIILNEDEAIENEEIIETLEIVKRIGIKRARKSISDQSLGDYDEYIEEQIVQENDPPVEHIDTTDSPQILEDQPKEEEEEQDFEITFTMPEVQIKRPSISIDKPTTRNIIKLKPREEKIEEKPVEKQKRPKIDITTLKPIMTKKFFIDDYEEAEPYVEEEEEEVINTDDWLARWCIFKGNQQKNFAFVFDQFDYLKKGFINGENLLAAIKKALPLNSLRLSYLMRVMCMCEVDPFKYGADKKTFSVMIALAQKIKELDDEWFHNILPVMNALSVEEKVFKVKKLWDFLVDKDTKTVRLRDLIIEMQAGGVTQENLRYAREKFDGKASFDLLDYLTYIPLFVHIHQSIIDQPFNRDNQNY